MTALGAHASLRRDFATTVQAVRDALATEGFGVLTEIDVRATLHEKIGARMEPYLILGVCNPTLAHRALDVDRSIGLLLPCTVVVRGAGDQRTVVESQDPNVLVTLTGRPELEAIAAEAGRRLADAFARLADLDAA